MRRRRFPLCVPSAFLMTALFMSACSAGDAKSRESQPSAPQAIAVAAVAAVEQPIARFIRASGTLTAEEEAEVAAETPGRVVSAPVELGTRVAAGAELIRLSAAETEAQLQEPGFARRGSRVRPPPPRDRRAARPRLPPSPRLRSPKPGAHARQRRRTHGRRHGTRSRRRVPPPSASGNEGTVRATRSQELLERVLAPVDVHPRPLVELERTGRALGVDTKPDPGAAAFAKDRERVQQERQRDPTPAPWWPHAEDPDPAVPRVARPVHRAEADPGDLVAFQREEVERAIEVRAFEASDLAGQEGIELRSSSARSARTASARTPSGRQTPRCRLREWRAARSRASREPLFPPASRQAREQRRGERACGSCGGSGCIHALGRVPPARAPRSRGTPRLWLRRARSRSPRAPPTWDPPMPARPGAP